MCARLNGVQMFQQICGKLLNTHNFLVISRTVPVLQNYFTQPQRNILFARQSVSRNHLTYMKFLKALPFPFPLFDSDAQMRRQDL